MSVKKEDLRELIKYMEWFCKKFSNQPIHLIDLSKHLAQLEKLNIKSMIPLDNLKSEYK